MSRDDHRNEDDAGIADRLADGALQGWDWDAPAPPDASSDDSLELAAAAADLALARAGGFEDMPPYLTRKIRAGADRFFAPPVTPARRVGLLGLSGWVVAAAASLVLAFQMSRPPSARPGPEAPPPTQVADLLASAPRAAMKPTGHPLARGAAGELAWDAARQRGAMTIRGLAPVDPKSGVYQLWIFDKKRDRRYPVDGGVFTIADGQEAAVIPIRAALRVDEPTLFAVTLEPPGGVVVSDRKRVLLAAEWTP